MIVSRILPGEDLKKGIENIRVKNDLKSGIILCIVGSLNRAVLRMSNADEKVFNGPFEIVSAEGTIAENGIHIHIAISDVDGAVFGGHLKTGCIVHTTAEICILEVDKPLKRVFDSKTGYKELFVGDN